jgi:alcohol dehydrogenase, propanol-preferring
MKAMILKSISSFESKSGPLVMTDLSIPSPSDNELLIKVIACGVCHTELDEIEGRTPPPVFPVVPGHQVVGTVEEKGSQVKNFNTGDRVGVGWIFSSCGKCSYCLAGHENLCAEFKATGRDANGGYAEYMVVPETSAHRIPALLKSTHAAPLLCAGAVGYRALSLSGISNGANIGLTGFGGSNHIVLQIIKYLYPDSSVFVFARSENERTFAIGLGASWAGDTSDVPPEKMNCIIDTTPVWKPVIEGLKNLKPGGRLVINAIRKEEIDRDELLKLDYSKHLWMEKEIKSVANVTGKDITDFLALAAKIPVVPEIQEYSLDQANIALRELKMSKIRGSKVLILE